MRPGARKNAKPRVQELGLRSITSPGGSMLQQDPDALVAANLLDFDEKHIEAFKLYCRILNILSSFHRSPFQ